MLMLTRKLGESVIIGDRITVTVVGVLDYDSAGEYAVKLGFDAPPDVEIWREEIYSKARGTGLPAKKLL